MHVKHDPDLRLLRAFATVAERGGFSAAAETLHVTQPALSRRIGELESLLGLRLFDRTSRRVRLTPAGEDLLARSLELLKAGEALRERSHALAAGKAGTLRIGCAPMVMESVVAPMLAQYRRRFPDVDVQLHEHGGARALEGVLRGELHAALASLPEPRLKMRLLFPWRLVAVVSSAHPLAHARTVEVAKLAVEPILTLPREFGTRALFDAGCETAGVRPAVRMEAAAAQTLVAAARAGYGVAIVPSLLIMNPRGVKGLPVLAEGKSLGRWQSFAWDGRRSQPAYVSAFADVLAESLAQGYPGASYDFAPRIRAPGKVAAS